jgi:hypothetical protein
MGRTSSGWPRSRAASEMGRPSMGDGTKVASDVGNEVGGGRPGRRCGLEDRSWPSHLIERVRQMAGPVPGRSPRPVHRTSGGCAPTVRRARRRLMSAGPFRCKAVTVARPVAVRPSICRKSVRQAKWRDQRWRRGLNRGTIRLVCGSRDRVLSYLWPLHAGHDQASSSAVLPAPSTRGRTCSQTKGAHE